MPESQGRPSQLLLELVVHLDQLAPTGPNDRPLWRKQIELNTELVAWLRDLTARVEQLEAR